eukprot:CAMPEP_0170520926 /NCGR_PEP_ID=MMETSP0209-20121228/6253_1 /TAXON_ID=665100 ORGANISM="Litonotus pictus, Strain P1" /NCGR_SAMPLE_ID=MMETSP0209 /ASSEMBLY_ACC=CAM_ASM_000301 /LENGTH=569 /DNA_ID=CAMNT_0010807515 /DNA_START=11 /DNA_END=1723 /DNA_ORIENTATION=+
MSAITLWLTGLSGAGKSTISEALKKKLDSVYGSEVPSFIFDGDVIRKGLNKDLGFSKEDRAENIRRIAEVSKLFNSSGQISIVSFISPYASERNFAKEVHQQAKLPFFEIHVSTSLEVCEKRDVKGLYKKARAGEIKNFTGVSDPYEEPRNPDINIDTNGKTVEDCVRIILDFIYSKGLLKDQRYLVGGEKSILSEQGLEIEEEEFNWLQCIQQGWVPSSIKCFMNEEQLLESLYFKTSEGSLQSLPVIFPVNSLTQVDLSNHTGKSVKLLYKGKPVAQIENLSTYPFAKEEVSAKLFGTISNNHPKINKYANKTHLVTGDSITFLEKLSFDDGLDNYRLSPEEIKSQILEKKADCVYAFQLRNPLHNGHCMLLNDTRKQLIEKGYKNPVLLLHPCGGWTKDDDVPLKARVEQHHAIMSNGALDSQNTILAVWPAPMFYAGPLEVLFHFSSRVLSGVDFMIVGRDPAGIKHPEDKSKDLYDPTHGAKILSIASKKGLLNKTTVIPFKVAVYNKETKSMEYFNPENKEKYENISGSKMREIAKIGQSLPEGFMNPSGWKVLVEYYNSIQN